MVAAAREAADRRGVDAAFATLDATGGLPYDDDAFDAVVCLGLLESLSAPAAVLDDLVRVLADDGVLAVSLYRNRATLGAALSRSWYVERLETRGFERFDRVDVGRSHDVLVARRTGAETGAEASAAAATGTDGRD